MTFTEQNSSVRYKSKAISYALHVLDSLFTTQKNFTNLPWNLSLQKWLFSGPGKGRVLRFDFFQLDEDRQSVNSMKNEVDSGSNKMEAIWNIPIWLLVSGWTPFLDNCRASGKRSEGALGNDSDEWSALWNNGSPAETRNSFVDTPIMMNSSFRLQNTCPEKIFFFTSTFHEESSSPPK